MGGGACPGPPNGPGIGTGAKDGERLDSMLGVLEVE